MVVSPLHAASSPSKPIPHTLLYLFLGVGPLRCVEPPACSASALIVVLTLFMAVCMLALLGLGLGSGLGLGLGLGSGLGLRRKAEVLP